MKLVEYTDEDGKQQISIVRDTDTDMLSAGIRIEPPPLDDILDEAKVELHNELVKRNLFTYLDFQKRPDELGAAINKVVTQKIIARLRQIEKQNKE
jgi:hypothetical protein